MFFLENLTQHFCNIFVKEIISNARNIQKCPTFDEVISSSWDFQSFPSFLAVSSAESDTFKLGSEHFSSEKTIDSPSFVLGKDVRFSSLVSTFLVTSVVLLEWFFFKFLSFKLVLDCSSFGKRECVGLAGLDRFSSINSSLLYD